MPTLRDTYRHGLSALLADADRLGRTPDDIAARVVVLAELRHAIAAGLGEDAPVDQPKPAKERLVWGREGRIHYLAPAGVDMSGAHYSTGPSYAFRYHGGGAHDRRVPVDSLAEGLRVITDMARADGYEVPDHPDAAPATTATDAPTLPPGLRSEDGWIAWGGGACPCHDWPEVEYVMRGGNVGPHVDEPGALKWERTDTWIDILAYRRPR